MVTEVLYWLCDDCHTRYKTRQEALDCEAKHAAEATRLQVVKVRWDNPKAEFPAVIWVKNKSASGNKVCRYTSTNQVKVLAKGAIKNGA